MLQVSFFIFGHSNKNNFFMKETTSREKVLKNIRNALINPSVEKTENIDFDSPIYFVPDESPEMIFAQKFTALTGKFAFCEDTTEFLEILHGLALEQAFGKVLCFETELIGMLKDKGMEYTDKQEEITSCKVALTTCECLISRTGSIVVSSKQASGRKLPVFPDIHLIVAYTSQLKNDVKEGLAFIKEKYNEQPPSMISFITGPSRTADIEKTLVLGAHGPKELYLFLIDDSTVQ
jgi:L-lactate dehydrogenase complex protein LldG